MPDEEICSEVCGANDCDDRCARPSDHEGLHLTADGICAWNSDRTWFGPGGTEEFREMDRA